MKIYSCVYTLLFSFLLDHSSNLCCLFHFPLSYTCVNISSPDFVFSSITSPPKRLYQTLESLVFCVIIC